MPLCTLHKTVKNKNPLLAGLRTHQHKLLSLWLQTDTQDSWGPYQALAKNLQISICTFAVLFCVLKREHRNLPKTPMKTKKPQDWHDQHYLPWLIPGSFCFTSFIYIPRLDSPAYTAIFKMSLRTTEMAPRQPAPFAEHPGVTNEVDQHSTGWCWGKLLMLHT